MTPAAQRINEAWEACKILDTSCWTPRGCYRANRATQFFNALVDRLGPSGVQNVVQHLRDWKPGPQEPPHD